MRVYLDHNATTPVRDEVVAAMMNVLRGCHGNPSSVHAEGSAARELLENARADVATLVGVEPSEILFGGGATEANNTVVRCVAQALGDRGRHVVTTTVEHPSVEAPLAGLEAQGWRVTRVDVDAEGRVDPARIEAAIEADTVLVSVIWANNETGVLQPMAEIARRVQARGVVMHSDATQAIGKIPVDLGAVPLDFLSLTAHKFGGPKGAGCLVVRGDLAFEGLLIGGPQERRRRGGTENVAGIVGLGVTCALASRELAANGLRYAQLRDRLWEGIQAKIPSVRRNGSVKHVLPNTLSVEFEATAGEVLMQSLDVEGVAVSAGAACASGSVEPSRVLLAMGRSPAEARGTLRFGVGHGVDEVQVDRVLQILPDLVTRVREAGNA